MRTHAAWRLCVQILKFEKLENDEDRIKSGRDIYDQFIMKELLSQSHVRDYKFLCIYEKEIHL